MIQRPFIGAGDQIRSRFSSIDHQHLTLPIGHLQQRDNTQTSRTVQLRRLHLHRRHLRGELPILKIGRAIRIRRGDLLDFIAGTPRKFKPLDLRDEVSEAESDSARNPQAESDSAPSEPSES